MRTLVVFGTRPEAIKLAPVIQALRAQGSHVSVCVTAQHRDMLDQVLAVFDIRPDVDLNLMRDNQSPLDVARRISRGLVPVFEAERPDWLIVQGDTTTTFAAAWVAFHLRVKIAHVEAGLRTGDKFHPFPEEINRRLTTVLADLHLAPTPGAAENLRREGVAPERIQMTGNPVVDALRMILDRPVRFGDERLEKLSSPMLLVTAHRRENFGEPLRAICHAVIEILREHPMATAVFPVHRNPSVRKMAHELLDGTPRLLLTDPLAYPEFVHLMKRSSLILSDSGGVQEEAPSVGTPVLILREVTERPEAVESGWAQLVGTSRERIVAAARKILVASLEQKSPAPNPFGDGHAARRIAESLARFSAAQGESAMKSPL